MEFTINLYSFDRCPLSKTYSNTKNMRNPRVFKLASKISYGCLSN